MLQSKSILNKSPAGIISSNSNYAFQPEGSFRKGSTVFYPNKRTSKAHLAIVPDFDAAMTPSDKASLKGWEELAVPLMSDPVACLLLGYSAACPLLPDRGVFNCLLHLQFDIDNMTAETVCDIARSIWGGQAIRADMVKEYQHSSYIPKLNGIPVQLSELDKASPDDITNLVTPLMLKNDREHKAFFMSCGMSSFIEYLLMARNPRKASSRVLSLPAPDLKQASAASIAWVHDTKVLLPSHAGIVGSLLAFTFVAHKQMLVDARLAAEDLTSQAVKFRWLELEVQEVILTSLTGVLLLHKLGVCKPNIPKLAKFISVLPIRARRATPSPTPQGRLLNAFINSNVKHMVVVENQLQKVPLSSIPDRIVLKYITGSNVLLIVESDLRHWVIANGYNIDRVTDYLKSIGSDLTIIELLRIGTESECATCWQIPNANRLMRLRNG